MNNKKLSILLATITITTVGCNVGMWAKNVELNNKILNQSEKIDNLNSDIDGLNGDIAEILCDVDKLNLTIDEKNKIISGLEEELTQVHDELESARRNIEEVSRITSFNDSDVTIPSNATVSHMRRALEGTALIDVANALVAAEKEYGINAFFLAAIAAHESAWGASDRAISTNNLTGYAVYDRTSRGATPDSRDESILMTARLLMNNYVNPGSQYYDNEYGASVRGINTKYCQDNGQPDLIWTKNITQIAYSLRDKANNF